MPRQVDTFMNGNIKRYRYFDDPDAQVFEEYDDCIPSLSLEEADEMYGIGEKDFERGFSIILPQTSFAQDRHDIVNLMNYHKEKVNIMGECECSSEKKVRHHPDYNKPYDVIKLCPKCHGKEHSRMNKEKKQLLVSMIAVKMLYH
jgi:hypothetical protein